MKSSLLYLHYCAVSSYPSTYHLLEELFRKIFLTTFMRITLHLWLNWLVIL